MQNFKSATLPNRRYGGRVAQKKAIFESLASDSLSSSVSTSSIEFSTSSFRASSDFSDRKTPFSYSPAGYRTVIDRHTQTEGDLGMEKVGRLFLALKNKSSELHSLTGDGRLDLMDVLLEFTKVVKEMKNTSSGEKDSSDTSQKVQPGNDNFMTKTRKLLSEKGSLASLLYKNSTPKPFCGSAGYNWSGRPRFQVCDLNLRRMPYSEYKDLLDKYAKERRWSSGVFKK